MELKHIHFAAYAFVYMIYGCAVTALGPIIIYYSKVTGEDETYFSFIFLARAVGYIIGGSSIKYLTDHYSHHRLLVFLIFLCAYALIFSSFDLGFVNQAVTMMVAGAAVCMMSILSNLCVFQMFDGEGQDYWLQLLNMFFSIAGLISPLIVIYYQQLAMRALGIFAFAAVIPFFFLDSPQGQHSPQRLEQKKKQLVLPRAAEVSICIIFLLYIGEEVGYAGWIPTYAVKAKVADSHQASALASLFWAVNTIARLILLKLPGSVEKRLTILLRCLVVGAFIVVVIQWMGNLTVVAYAGVISSGFFLSSMYALFFSIAQEYGYGLSTSNTANFTMCACLADGFLVMPIGYSMGLFGYQSLIYIIFLFSAVMLAIFSYANALMATDSEEQKKRVEGQVEVAEIEPI